jgi:hypothetical protein
VLIPLKVLRDNRRSERNQFGQKKKIEGGEKGNLGKTHFGGNLWLPMGVILNSFILAIICLIGL